MTVEELLAPVSDEAPAGVDLSYDGERQAIERDFELAGQGATDIDWRETVRMIEKQSSHTKDVWLAVYLARAGARLGQLDTVQAGCAMLAGLLERYWDSVYPALDEYGVQGRKGPCESLTRIGEFLGPLRRTVLLDHARFGSYSGEDFARFADEGEQAEGYGMFRAALADIPVETLQVVIDRLDGIRDALRHADIVLTEKAATVGDTGTNFQPAYDAIEAIRRAVVPHAGISVEEVAEEAASVSAAPPQPARIDTREDVVRMLDAIGDYYRRREPSSPVPIALRRVRGWITMDFMAILNDIAPNSVSDVGSVLLARGEGDDRSY
jgi:type VI secretion system protein ImpA